MAWIEKTGPTLWRVRWRRADGTTGSVTGFRSEKVANNYADEMKCDQRRGTWLDPSGFRTTVAEWVERWWPSLDLDTRTLENYDSYLRCHILPRFGSTPLGSITTLDIKLWTKQAAQDGYAQATISGWVNLLSMILTDAVDQRLIPTNPIHKHRRRGRRSRRIAPEKTWATPEQVLHIADQAGTLGGPTARMLIITAAWTGCRWGELTGLHRRNVDLHQATITIDREYGSLHESRSTRWIGPPKTTASARRILLPPFLVALLRAHLETHPYEYVFTTPSGTWWWRSTFIRRILRPAADGNHDQAEPTVRTVPVRQGLTFHGLRHSHKTWLIADNIPEIAQARRLGHHLDNRIVETYSHVAPELEKRLLDHLEHRWHTAQHTADPSLHDTSEGTSRPPVTVPDVTAPTPSFTPSPGNTKPWKGVHQASNVRDLRPTNHPNTRTTHKSLVPANNNAPIPTADKHAQPITFSDWPPQLDIQTWADLQFPKRQTDPDPEQDDTTSDRQPIAYSPRP